MQGEYRLSKNAVDVARAGKNHIAGAKVAPEIADRFFSPGAAEIGSSPKNAVTGRRLKP
jgi:hypothetical protein